MLRSTKNHRKKCLSQSWMLLLLRFAFVTNVTINSDSLWIPWYLILSSNKPFWYFLLSPKNQPSIISSRFFWICIQLLVSHQFPSSSTFKRKSKWEDIYTLLLSLKHWWHTLHSLQIPVLPILKGLQQKGFYTQVVYFNTCRKYLWSRELYLNLSPAL